MSREARRTPASRCDGSDEIERLIIGGNTAVYESMDRGDTIAAEFPIGPCCGGVAYGGRLGGVANPDVLYLGSAINGTVSLRTAAGGSPTLTPGFFAGGVQGITLDSTNWHTAYVISPSKVYRTTDAGSSWADITGSLPGAGHLWTIEFLPLAVGTDHGVYVRSTTNFGTWYLLATNLPNVRVRDLDYNATDNVLVAGTFGRGAFKFNFGTASGTLSSSPTIMGPWTDVSGAMNGGIITLNLSGPGLFYRVAR